MDALNADMEASAEKLEHYLVSLAGHPQGAVAALDLILNLSIHVHLLGQTTMSTCGLLRLCEIAGMVTNTHHISVYCCLLRLDPGRGYDD